MAEHEKYCYLLQFMVLEQHHPVLLASIPHNRELSLEELQQNHEFVTLKIQEENILMKVKTTVGSVFYMIEYALQKLELNFLNFTNEKTEKLMSLTSLPLINEYFGEVIIEVQNKLNNILLSQLFLSLQEINFETESEEQLCLNVLKRIIEQYNLTGDVVKIIENIAGVDVVLDSNENI